MSNAIKISLTLCDKNLNWCNQKGLLQNFDVKFTNGRADSRTNERIIGRNDKEIYTPRHILYDWDVVKLKLVQM